MAANPVHHDPTAEPHHHARCAAADHRQFQDLRS
jgi:hypothetical protein